MSTKVVILIPNNHWPSKVIKQELTHVPVKGKQVFIIPTPYNVLQKTGAHGPLADSFWKVSNILLSS